ncbi:MAG: AMP-binding protein, partial [Desulfosalsimonadaceae bacterium]|nr:AMP-binding protein [Desulfosalsimonadaceae bacterium]
MFPLNLKTIVRNGFWFVNFGSMIRLTMGLPTRANRVFFVFEGKEYTYREVYDQARQYGDFFLALRQQRIREGSLGEKDRLCIGIYQENAPEYMFAALGAGLSNSTLFAVNTGFRGKTLAGVLNNAGVAYLLMDGASAGDVHRAIDDFQNLTADRIFITGPMPGGANPPFMGIETAMAVAAPPVESGRAPMDNTAPVLVIYTSGTTGMPKGVPCTHLKMIGAGAVVQSAVRLKQDDRGYVCMPLFHSNAWYIGILPVMISGASFVLKHRFSAGAFEEDILKHGVTFMNYVGQPLHYIIAALEKKYGSPAAVETALARHPANRFRAAYGNGAPPIDRRKLMRYLGMEHIFEIYGSTEAVITTANKPGDPVESLGRLPKSVVILNEQGEPCPPAIVDEKGQIQNYDAAVGEITKKADANNLR